MTISTSGSSDLPQISGGDWLQEDYDMLATALFDGVEEAFNFDNSETIANPVESGAMEARKETAVPLRTESQPSITPVTAISSPKARSKPNHQAVSAKKRRLDLIPSKAPVPIKRSYVPIAPACTDKKISQRGPGSTEALEKFMKAVAISAKESSQKRPSDNMTSKEELDFRRERNRVMAKQTRERKKVQIGALTDQLQFLQRENAMLKRVVNENVEQPSRILKQCTAMTKIPREIWESYGIKLPQSDFEGNDTDGGDTSDFDRQDTPMDACMLLDMSVVKPGSVITPLIASSSGMTVQSSGSAAVVSTADDEESSLLSSSSSIPNPLQAKKLHSHVRQPSMFGKPAKHFC